MPSLWSSALERGIGRPGSSSPDLAARVASTKVLCVGAGGIGCELLKTLVLSGFREIDVFEMDTFFFSNLNRQFLFRARHVGQPKASVAAAAAAALAPVATDVDVGASGSDGAATTKVTIPRANVTPHRGDVRSPEYGVSFFSRFDLVLNGLDNVAARRHVNRVALAAKVPLIESGTAGHLGQVTVHFRSLRDGAELREQREGKGEEGNDESTSTECYECSPKPTPKSFPVCTIRSTPEKPIHCVVWSKELMFSRLVGPPDAASDLEKGGGKGDGDEGEGGAAARPSLLRSEGEALSSYAARVYTRLFDEDVREAAAIDELWESGERPRPSPLPLAELLASPGGGDAPSSAAAVVERIEGAVSSLSASGSPSPASFSAARALGLSNDHSPWPASSWARLFLASLAAFHSLRPSDVGSAAFDKDDRLACELVASGAALRAAAYRIGTDGGGGGSGSGGSAVPMTLFEVRGMAGNIIHALATTNAVVAGLITAEALKLVSRCPSSCRVTWIRSAAAAASEAGGRAGRGGGRLLVSGAPPPPADGCAVCGSARLELECDPDTFSLSELVDDVLKGRLALVSPTLLTSSGFFWEDPRGAAAADLDDDEVDAYERSLPKSLSSLPGGGLVAGTVVAVKDQAQAVDLNLLIVRTERKEGDEGEEPPRFVLRGSAPAAAAAEEKEEDEKGKPSPSPSSDLQIVSEGEAAEGGEGAHPDEVEAAEEVAAEAAKEAKMEEAEAEEEEATTAAAATTTAATAAAAEEEQKGEEQPAPPSQKRPRRAAADKGRETVREAMRENARGSGGGGRGRKKAKK